MDEIYVRSYFCRCSYCGNITKRLKCQSCGAPVSNVEYEEEGYKAKYWDTGPYYHDGGVSVMGHHSIWSY